MHSSPHRKFQKCAARVLICPGSQYAKRCFLRQRQPRCQGIYRFSASVATRVAHPGWFFLGIFFGNESRGLAESSRRTPNSKLEIDLKSDGYRDVYTTESIDCRAETGWPRGIDKVAVYPYIQGAFFTSLVLRL